MILDAGIACGRPVRERAGGNAGKGSSMAERARGAGPVGGAEAKGAQAGVAATEEGRRLAEDAQRLKNWKRWGPYLSERQWGTVREDYSADGSCWEHLPHDHARSRAYRWGEDGLLGICDRECRLCFGLALWNGRDPILKERLFGLTGPEGNHGEDVKEEYFYLDSTPTHSYLRALYKYPQGEFPYTVLSEENRRRSRLERELELRDTGIFDEGRYFDVTAEYAKGGPGDVLIRVTVANRGPEAAELHVLPTVWFRNTWSWGATHEGSWAKPRIEVARQDGRGVLLRTHHESLGEVLFAAEAGPGGAGRVLMTENETNSSRLFGQPGDGRGAKDAFHECVVRGREDVLLEDGAGTKAAVWRRLRVPAGGTVELRMRLWEAGAAPAEPFGEEFERTFRGRRREADEFYGALIGPKVTDEERDVARQAYAGLLWSKQFYHYVVEDWLRGDPAQPPPPAERLRGRNSDWKHLFSRDVLSMPDKWEYPWFAAWDLAFHMIAFAHLDPDFAKRQLLLLLREWYMHPSGQIPAYEFAFDDVNPPVHAWACWRVYKMTGGWGGKGGGKSGRDLDFLARAFQKLLLNFTWWVNRKDPEGKHIFAGGFLGLDNIGAFDRGRPLPSGGHLEQADGTAWMAFYCGTMLSMALELAQHDPVYEDIASKFFEHFVAITDAMNTVGGTGLWNDADGFYYDQVLLHGRPIPIRVRSLVGIVPLLAVEVIDEGVMDRLPGFRKRTRWFLENRRDLARHISYLERGDGGAGGKDGAGGKRLLAIPSRERLERVLRYVLDEREFLSGHGVRSLSRWHGEHPATVRINSEEFTVRYEPAESETSLFGGNSNWRGPVWFPINYLLIEALERYHHFYGSSFVAEFPSGSGRTLTLDRVAHELRRRLCSLFLRGADGRRPCFGGDGRFALDPHWRDLLLFHEYFHGETGEGLGASHQTGWTALVGPMLHKDV